MQALRRPSLDAAHPLAHLAVLMAPKDYPQTPDGRYFVASGKLWRCSDPRLTPEQKASGDITNSRAIIDACKPFHWKDDFPMVNAPGLDVLREAKEKFGYLMD